VENFLRIFQNVTEKSFISWRVLPLVKINTRISDIHVCIGKDTFEEISNMEWYFRGEFGNFEELLEIPCNGKVPLRYQDLTGMCCPLHELTLYRHCNEFN
jgi:hypothetical protein